jgi:hypothetical protein
MKLEPHFVALVPIGHGVLIQGLSFAADVVSSVSTAAKVPNQRSV